jgi:glycosyltransferase involved in cell wall biosynthesis
MIRQKRLHGIVIINSFRNELGGCNKSLSNAETLIHKLGVNFYYFIPSNVTQFFTSLLRFIIIFRRYSFDFALFNGSASIFHGIPAINLIGKLLVKKKIPIFFYWHEADMAFEIMRNRSSQKLKWIDDFICQNVNIVHLCASKFTGDSVRRRYGHVLPEIIYENSFVPRPFHTVRKPSNPPLVVNLASIQNRKGTDLFVETAIKVCKNHPTVEFIWMGEGNHFGTWKDDIRAAGFENRILFPGHVDSAYLILRESSVFFMSSRDDPMPLSVIEAMSLGKTIVSFNSGGTPEVLGDKCIVVPNFNTDLAAKAILSCLEKSSSELINEAVRNIYYKKFTPSKFAERLNLVIRKSLNNCYQT